MANQVTRENIADAQIDDLESFIKAHYSLYEQRTKFPHKPVSPTVEDHDDWDDDEVQPSVDSSTTKSHEELLEEYRLSLIHALQSDPKLPSKDAAQIKQCNADIAKQEALRKSLADDLTILRDEKRRLEEALEKENASILAQLKANIDTINSLLKKVSRVEQPVIAAPSGAGADKNALLAAIRSGLQLKKTAPSVEHEEHAKKKEEPREALLTALKNKKQPLKSSTDARPEKSELERLEARLENLTKSNASSEKIRGEIIALVHQKDIELSMWQSAVFKRQVQEQLAEQQRMIDSLRLEVQSIDELEKQIKEEETSIAKVKAETQENIAEIEKLKNPPLPAPELESSDAPPAPPAPELESSDAPSAPPPPPPPLGPLGRSVSAPPIGLSASKTPSTSHPELGKSMSAPSSDKPDLMQALVGKLAQRRKDIKVETVSDEVETAEEKEARLKIEAERIAREKAEEQERLQRVEREKQEEHQIKLTKLNARLGIKSTTDEEIQAASTAFSVKEKGKIDSKAEKSHGQKIENLKQRLAALKIEQQTAMETNAQSKRTLEEARATAAMVHTEEAIQPVEEEPAIPLDANKVMETIFATATIFQEGVQMQIHELESLKPKYDSNSYRQLLALTNAEVNITEFLNEQKKLNQQTSGDLAITKEQLDFYAKGLHKIVTNTETTLDKIGYPGFFRQFLSSIQRIVGFVFNSIKSDLINVSHRITEKDMKNSLKFDTVKTVLTTHFEEIHKSQPQKPSDNSEPTPPKLDRPDAG